VYRVPRSPQPEAREDDAAVRGPAGLRLRVVMTVLWSSFLVASVGTMVLFAFIDPTPVAALFTANYVAPSRTALYSLGFFCLWILCASAAGLAAWLLTTPTADRR
jgi:hypothetical protein